MESATSADRPTTVRASSTRAAPLCPRHRLGAQALADQLADRQPGGEGGAGVLEDHLGPRAPPELDGALVDRLEPGDGAQQRRLAAAALADQGHRLALGDLERDPAQGLEALAVERRPDGEALGDVVDQHGRWRATRDPEVHRGPRVRLDAFGGGGRHVAPADAGHAPLRGSLLVDRLQCRELGVTGLVVEVATRAEGAARRVCPGVRRLAAQRHDRAAAVATEDQA